MLKVAIVGSRKYTDLDRVRDYVRSLPENTLVISGNALGVDRTAQDEALKCELRVLILPARWSQGKNAGYVRNLDIVRAADTVIAFWDGESKGTMHTVTTARNAQKIVEVYGPDGDRLE